MSKATKITVIFILIFVIGVLTFVASINRTLNAPVTASLPVSISSSIH
ncbi:hypothetical protein JRG66_07315 [Salinimicrobium tongyeongense]|uniref:Uncharacterized protein n=1 Tax=Salinimicrobium tongyeongense TaxID=2809707 RepID=A0ABY6NW00_9FLAO|nr:hypothetical protein [Salinimicrobium tongyeongense]UZH56653.1 hypothetical protein JRG66_07315 [Salinimicrobium tongyeongense]